jgi:hypothetical protein
MDIRSDYPGAMEPGMAEVSRGRSFEAPISAPTGIVVVDIGG